MSYAVLFKSNEMDFNTLGLGVLQDAISPMVSEERNGQFELVMKYPVDGALFNEIKNDRLIKADASHSLKGQRFKIVRITKPAGGIITVYAEHISYLSQDLALKPEVSYDGNAGQALNTWQNNIVDEHPFTTFSDIQTNGSGKWTIDKVENARRALGGITGSMLDSYGGEYRFDNYHIGLYANRGSDSGALIAYGKNLTDLEQEEEIASTYTSIYPYTTIRDENGNESLLTLPEYFVDSEHADKYARRKIKTVNFQQDEITTVEQLRERTQQYIEANDIGVPNVNLSVKFLDLSKTLDYKALALVEEINLCDQVTVYYEKLDIRQKAKVIKTVWDVSLDRYDELVIGKAKASLSKSINTTVDGKLETVVTNLNSVRIAADGKTKIYSGVDVPTASNIDDLWYKPVASGAVEMYRWNGVIWELKKTSADALAGTVDFATVQAINIDANSITTGSLRADIVQAGFNGIAQGVSMTADGLKAVGPTGEFSIVENGGMSFHTSGGTNTGTIESAYKIADGQNGVGIFIQEGRFFEIVRKNESTGLYETYMQIPVDENIVKMLKVLSVPQLNIIGTNQYLVNSVGGGGAYIDSEKVSLGIGTPSGWTNRISVGDGWVDIIAPLNMRYYKITNTPTIEVKASGSTYGGRVTDSANRLVMGGYDGTILGWMNEIGGITAVIQLLYQEIRAFGTLNMNGNVITNQSDIRLKSKVVDTEIDPFSIIEKMRFIEFEWDVTNPYNDKKPGGRHFGIEAQYSPFLAVQDKGASYLSIDMGKQVNLNSLANQKLIAELKEVKQELADLKTSLTEKGVI